MSFFSTYLQKLALISLKNSADVDHNRKQVVNITYLLAIVVSFISGLIFVWQGWFSESLVHWIGMCASLVGFTLSIKGHSRSARMLLPFAYALYVSFCTFLFYGSQSHFQWLLIVLAAYSVAGYRVSSGKEQVLLCCFALLVFAFNQLFAPISTQYSSKDFQLFVTLATFIVAMMFVVLIAGVVVNKLRKLNEHLRYQAEVDELTRVSNRRKVLAEAVNVFADAVMSNQRCCFAILDLDHFKQINDRYGHDVGDRVLQRCAQVMQNSIRRGDWLGRYGGEEFVLIMPNTRLREAYDIMESLRIQISDLNIFVEGQDQPIVVTTSIGVAEIKDDTLRYEQILARADAALYLAKDNGRNRVELDMSELE
ncbi:diguanylate cyclase (GGDEF) domain [Marinomonas fungiae]|uniref:diguanylate cyclase n=1 Tax=Marinomonas fungiae TaxID=1137284 RepID=A0A0K6IJH8_9GAMM|nr:diguanylate cyclase (GGDEF) domain [Marinomonas fungiae]